MIHIAQLTCSIGKIIMEHNGANVYRGLECKFKEVSILEENCFDREIFFLLADNILDLIFKNSKTFLSKLRCRLISSA